METHNYVRNLKCKLVTTFSLLFLLVAHVIAFTENIFRCLKFLTAYRFLFTSPTLSRLCSFQIFEITTWMRKYFSCTLLCCKQRKRFFNNLLSVQANELRSGRTFLICIIIINYLTYLYFSIRGMKGSFHTLMMIKNSLLVRSTTMWWWRPVRYSWSVW